MDLDKILGKILTQEQQHSVPIVINSYKEFV